MKGVTEDGLPIIVCMPLAIGLQFADNLIDRCRFCQCDVQLRPHMPWPRHVACIACFMERYEEKDDVLAVTSKTIAELRDLAAAARKQH